MANALSSGGSDWPMSRRAWSRLGKLWAEPSCERSRHRNAAMSSAPPIAEIEHPRQAARGRDGALDARPLFRHRLLERQLGRENAQQRVEARLDRRAGRTFAAAERRARRA